MPQVANSLPVRYRDRRYSGCCNTRPWVPPPGGSPLISGGLDRLPIVRVPSFRRAACLILPLLVAALMLVSLPSHAFAQASSTVGGEAQLVIPDLPQATFLGGTNGRSLLMWGLAICALGLL